MINLQTIELIFNSFKHEHPVSPNTTFEEYEFESNEVLMFSIGDNIIYCNKSCYYNLNEYIIYYFLKLAIYKIENFYNANELAYNDYIKKGYPENELLRIVYDGLMINEFKYPNNMNNY